MIPIIRRYGRHISTTGALAAIFAATAVNKVHAQTVELGGIDLADTGITATAVIAALTALFAIFAAVFGFRKLMRWTYTAGK